MSTQKIVIITSLIVFTILVIGVLLMFSLSGATEYCPLSHKVNPDMNCRIHDNINGKILIGHFNIDTNELELSIFENGKTHWIKHPEGELTNYNPSIEKNTLLFDRKNPLNLIVNDSVFSITILNSRK